jgi:hypothetical protein
VSSIGQFHNYNKTKQVKIIIEKEKLEKTDLLFAPIDKRFYLNKEENAEINKENLDVILEYKNEKYRKRYMRMMAYLKELDYIFEPNENEILEKTYNNYCTDEYKEEDDYDYDDELYIKK